MLYTEESWCFKLAQFLILFKIKLLKKFTHTIFYVQIKSIVENIIGHKNLILKNRHKIKTNIYNKIDIKFTQRVKDDNFKKFKVTSSSLDRI